MSVSLSIRNAVKRFGNTTVIPGLNLDIRDTEFFTLLGPSGCGKTTLLRMIAGFNTIEAGDFYFNDKRINDVDAGRRNIGMVFQNYAIFPHLTVRQNVEFGLKNRKLPKREIRALTDEFLRLMQIEGMADRMPERLSGGQQQRVALARAIVIKPDVLLMDEPLSNLDAKLRLEMREAIRRLQKEVGITTVYVTHDQEEAMAISDRIAVMKDGAIQQIGAPREIYHRPSNVFVATFIGRTNLIEAHYSASSASVRLGTQALRIEKLPLDADEPVVLSIRPEDMRMDRHAADGIKCMVADSVFLGMNTHYTVELPNGKTAEIIHESAMDHCFRRGDVVTLGIKTEKINVFSKDGSRNLLHTA